MDDEEFKISGLKSNINVTVSKRNEMIIEAADPDRVEFIFFQKSINLRVYKKGSYKGMNIYGPIFHCSQAAAM